MDSVSDEELVRRFLAGDGGAFTALVERHQRRVYNLAYRILGRPEDAVDAVQDVFLACVRKLGGFRGGSAFTTWLHRVTVNVCYDVLRKRRREQPLAEEDPPEPPPVPDHADASAGAVDVQRALLTLSPEFRAVLVLHDVQGVPYEEIADVLGAPLGTVKSRIHRARLALAEALGGEQRSTRRPSKMQETRE